jgi:putative addiction module component (TIGR02574 family)
MANAQKVIDQALVLSRADRSYVAERLLESLEEEHALSPQWQTEIARRIARREKGESIPVSKEQMRQDVQKLLAP